MSLLHNTSNLFCSQWISLWMFVVPQVKRCSFFIREQGGFSPL
jgi:hypothetical protein